MPQTIRIAIAGLGTVGGAVLRQLHAKAETIALRCGHALEVVAVSARDRTRDRGVSLDDIAWHADALELADITDTAIIVELIGGHEGTARALVEKALQAGKHVVTANKALCAHHGVQLAATAEANHAQLRFEAAIAGGVPVVKTVREALAGNRIREIRGILNGTCNHILTTMTQSRRSYAEALAEAQRLGYAEADPSLDLSGVDAAHKLALLSSLAFGHRPCLDAVRVAGIQAITQEDIGFAREFGYEIRLLAVAKQMRGGEGASGERIEQWARPALVPRDSLLTHVQGARNGISLRGDFGGNLFLAGDGAGGEATASAVVADIMDIACGRRIHPFGAPLAALPQCPSLPETDSHGRFYLRLHAADRPGSMAAVTRELAQAEISIERIMQTATPTQEPASHDSACHEGGAGGAEGNFPPSTKTAHLPVALLTHETRESAMRQAVDALTAKRDIVAAPLLLRVETR